MTLSFSTLPTEIKFEILMWVIDSQQGLSQLDNCRLVCQEWNQWSEEKYLKLWNQMKPYFEHSFLFTFNASQLSSALTPKKAFNIEANRLNKILERCSNSTLKGEIKHLTSKERLKWFFQLTSYQFSQLINPEENNRLEDLSLLTNYLTQCDHPRISIVPSILSIWGRFSSSSLPLHTAEEVDLDRMVKETYQLIEIKQKFQEIMPTMTNVAKKHKKQ